MARKINASIILEFLANKFLYTPQTLQTVVHALGCSPKRDGKTVAENTHPCVMDSREIKQVLTWKLFSCWLAFVVLESAMCLPDIKVIITLAPLGTQIQLITQIYLSENINNC